MKKPIYAIFDVGKTTKKLILFGEDRQIIKEHQEVFPQITDEDGFPCDDLNRLSDWVLRWWSVLRRSTSYVLKGVNFTAYGASFVHIGHDGRPVLPLYNYLKPLPLALTDRFYGQWASQDAFAIQTCSPRLGMLNSGLQLYWLKHERPADYARIHTTLHLPQYLSYLITGEFFSDYTSVGCHTALWNFSGQTYQDWVFAEGIDEKLAPLTRDSVASVVDDRLVGVGLHDSSAAVVPYLLQSQEPFMLISTGTWCINLNPFNQQALSADRLRRDCLNYLSPKGETTKASRVFFGHEHDYQVDRIAEHFGVSTNFYKSIRQTDLHHSSTDPFRPACMSGTGPYPNPSAEAWDLSAFHSPESAYGGLMRGLMDILAESIGLIDQGEQTLYLDGGFARNVLFQHLLSHHFPNRTIHTLNIPQAAALGALMHVEQGEAHKQTRLLFV